MIVKICGVTRAADAAAAAAAGADWIGINFWPGSKRRATLEQAVAAAAAARAARPGVVIVGVFVDEEPARIDEIAGRVGLDRVQLHGDEAPAVCAGLGARAFKALALGDAGDLARLDAYGCDPILVDTPSTGRGGSGVTGDWELARRAVATGRRILLAGGLTVDNVAAAVRAVGPWGVDVASGVESAPGIKDPERVARFIEEARRE
ncbi:MAG TPA: phosphoribosylanthranilate isomerase [Kofleriaceae bacterium]|nr:phosphoribosylanthranilate isomerase [Kofleriaceae bacterium]